MPPRPRNRKNRSLPPNLYTQTKGGVTYYTYRHPVTSKQHGMGKDKREAIRAANILNARLLSEPNAEALVAKVEAPKTDYLDYVEHFLDEVLLARPKPLSDRTLGEYRRYLELSAALAGLAGVCCSQTLGGR